jgi:hypothetical protein
MTLLIQRCSTSWGDCRPRRPAQSLASCLGATTRYTRGRTMPMPLPGLAKGEQIRFDLLITGQTPRTIMFGLSWTDDTGISQRDATISTL